MADVAFPVLPHDLGLELDAEQLGQQLGEVEDRRGLAGTDVDGLVVERVVLEGQQVGPHDVAHVDEVARLAAVFEDERRLPVEKTRGEDGARARVGVRERLTGPVHVEVTKRDGRYAVGPSHHEAVLLLILLGDGVDRSRREALGLGRRERRQREPTLRADRLPCAGQQLLRRAQARIDVAVLAAPVGTLAIDRHRGRDDELLDAVAVGQHGFEEHGRAEVVGAHVAPDLVHRLTHAHLGGLVEDRVDTGDGPFHQGGIGDVTLQELDAVGEVPRAPREVDLGDEAVDHTEPRGPAPAAPPRDATL